MATLIDTEIRERLVSCGDLGVSRHDLLTKAKQREVPQAVGEALRDGKIILDPLPNLDEALQPISIDVRLGNIIEMVNVPLEIAEINGKKVIQPHTVWYGEESTGLLRNDPTRDFEVIQNGAYVKFRLHDGEVIKFSKGMLITPYTMELIAVPYDLKMTLEGRSSLARAGIATHVTSPRFDPGFIGLMTMEMINIGPLDVCIWQGQRVAALSFETLADQARPYHSILGEGGRFSGQD